MDHPPALDSVVRDGVKLLLDTGALDRGCFAAFSCRLGGVSAPPFESLNLASRSGDRVDHVEENRRRVAAAAGFPLTSLALARQVHGAGMLEVFAGQSGILGEGDVLVTRDPGPVLGVLTADCAPVMLIGEGGAAIAHAGWRGLVAGAVQKAVEAVAPVSAAWIGPCIHGCCYRVGEEVLEAFRSAGLPVAARDSVDPAQASWYVLRRAGVAHVAVAEPCTSCDPDYFSYRRDGLTGRQGAFLGWVDV
jgi:polyphenol oxidase